jgi:sortase (surface protein transpeptidase)
MKNRLFYLTLGSLVIFAVGVFCFTLYNALYVSRDAADGQFSPNMAVVASSTSTAPMRLTIPSLSIDANVQQVGITENGAMGIPSNFSDVAWYKYGPVPGAIGNAVIDGHLDNAISLPGVFKYLNAINIGDDIFVSNTSGGQTHFKVTKKETLDYNATSTDEIFEPSTTTPNLVLITCEGTWDQSVRQYSSRLVVFSTLVE